MASLYEGQYWKSQIVTSNFSYSRLMDKVTNTSDEIVLDRIFLVRGKRVMMVGLPGNWSVRLLRIASMM